MQCGFREFVNSWIKSNLLSLYFTIIRPMGQLFGKVLECPFDIRQISIRVIVFKRILNDCIFSLSPKNRIFNTYNTPLYCFSCYARTPRLWRNHKAAAKTALLHKMPLQCLILLFYYNAQKPPKTPLCASSGAFMSFYSVVALTRTAPLWRCYTCRSGSHFTPLKSLLARDNFSEKTCRIPG